MYDRQRYFKYNIIGDNIYKDLLKLSKTYNIHALKQLKSTSVYK